MTLEQFETRFRYYVNDSQTKRFTQTEAYYYINEAYKYYYERLVSCGFEGLLASPTFLNITANTKEVALPSDFLRARLVERVYSGSYYPMQYVENETEIEDTASSSNGTVFYYSFQGTNLVLFPTPTKAGTGSTDGIRLTYWPTATEMSATTDTPDSGFNSTWHGLIPIQAAVNAKAGREEQDGLPLYRLLSRIEQPFNDMIDRMTVARIQAEPFITGAF